MVLIARQRRRLARDRWLTGGAAAGWSTGWACAPPALCRLDRPGLRRLRAGLLARSRGSTWLPGVSDGAYWQLLTSAFTHVEIWHIGFNMLALWVLGPQLELAIGRVRFLALYLLSALAGSLLVYWLAPQYLLTLGASGAIFGLMGALLVLALKVGGQLQQLLMWIGINFVITVTAARTSPGRATSAASSAARSIAAVLVYAPRHRRTLWQSARPRRHPRRPRRRLVRRIARPHLTRPRLTAGTSTSLSRPEPAQIVRPRPAT